MSRHSRPGSSQLARRGTVPQEFRRGLRLSVLVLQQIAALLIIALFGAAAARGGYLPAALTGALSRLLVDLGLPALMFTSLLTNTDPDDLSRAWYLPLVGLAMVGVFAALGLASVRLYNAIAPQTQQLRGARADTPAFLAAIPNWIYLPLPILTTLHGGDGARTILLLSVGAIIGVWTIGIGTLKASQPNVITLIIKHPGIWAATLALATLALFPDGRQLAAPLQPGDSFTWAFGKIVFQGVAAVGRIVVPLSLVVLGALLVHNFRQKWRAEETPSIALTGLVLATRLLMAPLLMILVLRLGQGLGLTPIEQAALVVVASMPVAINAAILVERFGGDTPLAARGVLGSNLLLFGTLPLVMYLWDLTAP